MLFSVRDDAVNSLYARWPRVMVRRQRTVCKEEDDCYGRRTWFVDSSWISDSWIWFIFQDGSAGGGGETEGKEERGGGEREAVEGKIGGRGGGRGGGGVDVGGEEGAGE